MIIDLIYYFVSPATKKLSDLSSLIDHSTFEALSLIAQFSYINCKTGRSYCQ